jgi:amino acid transporter
MVSLVCLVIGNMIGSAVYISSSYALGALEDGRLVLLAWAVGGVHAICGAVAYAALARRIVLSGGEYAFLSRFFHPLIGFIAGWISLVAGFTAPIAAAALVFGEYICASPQETTLAKWVATVWIAACALFHWIDLRTGAWVNNGVVFLKMIGFAIFAIACIGFLSAQGPADASVPFVPALDRSFFETDYLSRLSSGPLLMTILIQLFFIALAYTGFNASIYIASEVEQDLDEHAVPRSNLVPNSMILASVIVTAIYLGLNYLFLACDTREAIVAGKDYFVSDVAYNVGGDSLRWVMRITIALSSATSVLAMLATGPRVYARMAQDGWLPSWFGSDSNLPRNAILIQAIASAIIVWFTTLSELISYLGITLTACGALATSILWIARREMASRRPIAWWEDACLAVYILGALLLIWAAWVVKPAQFWWCVGTFASGLLIYLVVQARSPRQA